MDKKPYHHIYKDGKLHGPCEAYYENGQLEARGTYKDGELHGPFEAYHENGQLMYKGTLHMGEECGKWTQDGKTVTYDPCPDCDEE